MELCTASKIFCACPTAFGAEPNRQICPVCTGMPGTLPVLNRKVVDFALRTALALGCSITPCTAFDRKNYMYPDLPKAYQISQLYLPIGRHGQLLIEGKDFAKPIHILELHMEEDAGKLVHDGEHSLIDFNRAGVPLLEIVSAPDFRSAEEVLAYLKALREILVFLGVSDCKMQEGSLRVDVNLSLRPQGVQTLGTRTEMKNLSSFKAVSRAIADEAARQAAILEAGGKIRQETRRWDDTTGKNVAMRSKEEASDYRYFPEPDLPPVVIDEQWVQQVQASMPELAAQKRERYRHDFHLSEEDIWRLTGAPQIAVLFEQAAAQSGQPKLAASLIAGELLRLMNETQTFPESLDFPPEKLAAIAQLAASGKINQGVAKTVLEAVFHDGVDPEAYVEAHGLSLVDDSDLIAGTIRAVLDANPKSVADYRGGKDRAFGFLVGQTMKALGGKANPQTVRQLLQQALGH